MLMSRTYLVNVEAPKHTGSFVFCIKMVTEHKRSSN